MEENEINIQSSMGWLRS